MARLNMVSSSYNHILSLKQKTGKTWAELALLLGYKGKQGIYTAAQRGRLQADAMSKLTELAAGSAQSTSTAATVAADMSQAVIREDAPATAGRRRTRLSTRPRVDVSAVENIRKRLGMTAQEFSIALGFQTKWGYTTAIAKGKVTQTLALAAEALSRRANVHGSDAVHYLLTVDNNQVTVKAFPVDAQRASIGGQEYVLVPTGDKKGKGNR